MVCYTCFSTIGVQNVLFRAPVDTIVVIFCVASYMVDVKPFISFMLLYRWISAGCIILGFFLSKRATYIHIRHSDKRWCKCYSILRWSYQTTHLSCKHHEPLMSSSIKKAHQATSLTFLSILIYHSTELCRQWLLHLHRQK